jgi:small subunit ribosomal protein S16
MAVKLRLQRKGRKQAPFYHIVVADARSPRDGRYIEKIGTYNPLTVPATIELNNERAHEWLNNGAQPTDTVRAILRFKGVLYHKHLMGGLKKGVLTQEQVDEKLKAYTEQKESRISARKEASAEKKRQLLKSIDGKPKAKPAPAPVVEEVVASAEETAAEEVVAAAEEVAEVAPAVAEEAAAPETEAPAAEEKTEE